MKKFLTTLAGGMLLVACGQEGTEHGRWQDSHLHAPEAGVELQASPTIYWLDIFGGRVYQADANGRGARSIARTDTAPDGIAIDVEGGKLYWTNMGSVLGIGSGTLQRSNLDGSRVQRIVREGISDTPKQMQVDNVNHKIYWSDREGAKVWRANKDGSNPEILISGHGLEQLVGVALDIPRRQVYFSDRRGLTINRISMDMPAGQSHSNRRDMEVLIQTPRRTQPIDLDLDLETRTLYWTDRSLGTVHRAPMDMPAGKNAGNRNDEQELVDGLGDAIGISLDRRNKKMYFTELNGDVWVSDFDGSSARRIASTGSATGVVFAEIP